MEDSGIFSYLSDTCEEENSNIGQGKETGNEDCRSESIRCAGARNENANDLMINIDSELLRQSSNGGRLITLTIATHENPRLPIEEQCDEEIVDPAPEQPQPRRRCTNKYQPPFYGNPRKISSSEGIEPINSTPCRLVPCCCFYPQDGSDQKMKVPETCRPIKTCNCTQTPVYNHSPQARSESRTSCQQPSTRNYKTTINGGEQNVSTSFDVTVEFKDCSLKKPGSTPKPKFDCAPQVYVKDKTKQCLQSPNIKVTQSTKYRNETPNLALEGNKLDPQARNVNQTPNEDHHCSSKITPECRAGIKILHDQIDNMIKVLEAIPSDITQRNVSSCQDILAQLVEIEGSFEKIVTSLCYSPLEYQMQDLRDQLDQIVVHSQEQPAVVLNYLTKFGNIMSELGKHVGEKLISATFPRLAQDIQIQMSVSHLSLK